MTKPPAFQFYVKDWLVATRHLSFAAKGVYIDLLAWSWDNGPIPKKLDEIARIAGAAIEEFSALWRELKRHWTRTADGFINARLERERAKYLKYSKLQSRKGKASAEARLNRGSSRGSNSVDVRLQPEGNSSSSSSDQDQDQDQREDAHRTFHDEARAAGRVLLRLAHDVLGAQDADAVSEGELVDRLKDLAARARIPYDSREAGKAIESARVQRQRRSA